MTTKILTAGRDIDSPDDIKTILEILATETLDPHVSVITGGFILPAVDLDDPMFGGFICYGRFYSTNYSFYIITTDDDVKRTFVTAIKANQDSKRYKDIYKDEIGEMPE